jgi:cytochrome c553
MRTTTSPPPATPRAGGGAARRFTLLCAALLCACIALPASAQNAAAIAKGRRIAMQGTPAGVSPCSSCHGANGEGAAAFPRLAAAGGAYLQAQLDAFANGSRQNAVMQPFAQKLAPDERAAVAAYFASLPAPVARADAPDATPTQAGAWLATRGRWSDRVPACAQCHGPGGSGVGASFPPLSGQSAAYLLAQLQAFQAGTRPPGPLGLMQSVASKLSAADIDAVSSYYAGLAAAATQAAASAPKEQRP